MLAALLNQAAAQATVIHLAVLTAIAIPHGHIHRTIHIPQGRVAVIAPVLIVHTAEKAHHQRKPAIYITPKIIMMLMISTMTTMTISGIMRMPRIITMNIMMIE